MAQLWRNSGAIPLNTTVSEIYTITMILFFRQSNNSKNLRTVRHIWQKVLNDNLLYLSA